MRNKSDPRRRQMLQRLTPIVEDTIEQFEHEPYTVDQVAQAALPLARDVCRDYLDDTTLDALLPIIRRKIPKHSSHASAQLPLRGFENIALPPRIAVPPPGAETIAEEDADDILWVELRRARIAEAERNIGMRDAIISGAQKERDLVFAVVAAARAAGGRDGDVIGVVLHP
jgi:hypothetical protein